MIMLRAFKKRIRAFKFFEKACFVPKLSQFKDFSRYSKKTGTRKFVMSHSSQGNADKLYWPITFEIIVEFSWYFIWSCSIISQMISNKNIFHNVNLSHLYNFFSFLIWLYWKKNLKFEKSWLICLKMMYQQKSAFTGHQ